MTSYSAKFESGHRFLIFGGTGSLGRTLVGRILQQNQASLHRIAVFSRDEAKHHDMKLQFPDVKYIIGDVRNLDSVKKAINSFHPTVVINAAAMKQVPSCEDYPFEALQTNAIGSHNIVRAVEEYPSIIHVLSISTDKACKPVNSYGMTKGLQERIHLNGNGFSTFNCVRYGNVLESTGSVIPFYKKLLSEGVSKLPVTHEDMTRFLLSLNQAVDLIFKALERGFNRKILIPKVKSAKVTDLVDVFNCDYSVTGIRPGEKIHEILISEEEMRRTQDLGSFYVIHPINSKDQFSDVKSEYSSANCLMTKEELQNFLKEHNVI